MCAVEEFVEAFARARYQSELELVDAGCIKLIDGTEIFTASLYGELLATPVERWPSIVDEWFAMLDLIRARIASTG